jgi:hypothetical protein
VGETLEVDTSRLQLASLQPQQPAPAPGAEAGAEGQPSPEEAMAMHGGPPGLPPPFLLSAVPPPVPGARQLDQLFGG